MAGHSQKAKGEESLYVQAAQLVSRTRMEKLVASLLLSPQLA